jgi:hypothetical protein
MQLWYYRMGREEPDDTDTLLAMMGFASVDATETGEITPSVEPNDPGEAFWQWLVTGCRSGSLIPNKADGRIHLVAGYVFCVRGIFHQFLTETNAPGKIKPGFRKRLSGWAITGRIMARCIPASCTRMNNVKGAFRN